MNVNGIGGKTMVDHSTVTREKILETARRCFALGGFHATGVEQIAREAGVSKGALYWHFKGKQEIYRAILEVEAETIRKAFDPGQEGHWPKDTVAFIIRRGERRFETFLAERESLLLWANIWIEAKRGQEEIRALYKEMTEAIFLQLKALFVRAFTRFDEKVDGKRVDEILESLGVAFDGLVLQLGVNLDVARAKHLWRYTVKRIIEGGESYV